MRVKKNRYIQMAPNFIGFEPLGKHNKTGESIIVNFEEYEALNLCDYELLTQAEAAKLMNVSRPTFTRIYESVRRKIAKAFVEGAAIQFEGGNYLMARWFNCPGCKISFSMENSIQALCPLCKMPAIV